MMTGNYWSLLIAYSKGLLTSPLLAVPNVKTSNTLMMGHRGSAHHVSRYSTSVQTHHALTYFSTDTDEMLFCYSLKNWDCNAYTRHSIEYISTTLKSHHCSCRCIRSVVSVLYVKANSRTVSKRRAIFTISKYIPVHVQNLINSSLDHSLLTSQSSRQNYP